MAALLSRDGTEIKGAGGVSELSAESKKIVNVGNPTDPQDAATKAYADSVAGGGDILGPVSSTNNAVSKWNGSDGNKLKNSGVIISDDNSVSGVTQLNVDNLRLDGNTISSTNTNGNISLAPNGTGTVGVNATSLEASAKLQVDSTVQGFLEPRMTTAQRDAIAIPAAGLQVYNITSNKLNFYNGTDWVDVGDVTGPSFSTNNRIARFDGITGKVIKDGSTAILSDTGGISGLTGLSTSGTTTLTGILSTSGNTTNTQTGESVNLTNATTAATRLTGVGLISVGGYAVTTSGRRNIIINTTGSTVLINNEDSAVTAANRISTGTGANITLPDGASIEIIYNATTARHQIIGTSAEYNLTQHINNTTEAHAAAAISNTPSGNLDAITVQAALDELQGDIDTSNTAISTKVTGPESSTNLAIARFNGTTGNLIQSGTGTITTAGAISGLTGLTSSGTATLSGGVSLSSNTANTQSGSNVNITTVTSVQIRLTNSSLTSIGGYSSTTSGRSTILINATGTPVTIINEDTTVTATNRIRTGNSSNITIENEASILLIYNATTGRHQVVGGYIAPAVTAKMFEFKVLGDIENPNLSPTSVSSWNPTSSKMTSAILIIDEGKIGAFKVRIVSYNADGTDAITHVSQDVSLASNGSSVISMSFDNDTIPASRVVKLLTQYVSGNKTSNISVSLQ